MEFKFSHRTEIHASHQPILYAYASKIFNGTILEFGAGYYSTPLLHYLCKKNNNRLYTFENNREWFFKMAEAYPCGCQHQYVLIEDYANLLFNPYVLEGDLVFLDSMYMGQRLLAIRETKAECKIIHDCERIFEGEKFKSYLTPKHHIYDELNPTTVVLFEGSAEEVPVDFNLTSANI